MALTHRKNDMPTADSPTGAIVVFGGAGGIGSELTRQLVRAGRQVLAAGRDQQKLAALAAELDLPTIAVDAADPATFDAAVQAAVEQFGAVSGVANCIGSLLLKPAHSTSDQQWQETLQTNLGSAFAAVRAAAKVMRNDGGAVALVSSAAAQIGLPSHEAIAAAKAGVEGLVRAAAATYASRGIRVNAVAPGMVKSPLTREIWSNETAAASSLQLHALGRFGEPRDIAAALAWLLDPQNSWVTGQIIGVDGGLSSVAPRPTARPQTR